MVEILAPVGPPVELDVCRPCQFAWFDPKEIDGVAPAPEETEPLPEIPPDPRWVLAMAKVEAIAKRYRAEVGPEPAVGWKFWPGFLGLPIEWEDRPLARVPVVTWTLTALIAVVSIVAFLGDLSAAGRRLGFVPVDPLRHWGLTLVTSFLLHGGIWHLAANLYFLLVFGDNVEEDLGRRRYVGLLVGAALAGDLFHGLFDLRPGMPVVGASTAISGIIVYYALRFPEARLGLLFRVWFVVVVRWIRFPAWVGLIGWVALQMLGVRRQVLGPTTISALGHLGGAAVGAAVWLWSRPGAALRPEGSGGAPGTEDGWAWLRQEPRYGLAVAMILVAVLVLLIALGGSPGLGVGVGLLFVAAQFAYCYRFRIIDDWMWAVLAALLGFWYFVTRGVPWVRSIGLAAAVSGFVVAYRVLRDRDRALLDD
jgi:membrane associated rhomboid family serine protease